MRECSNACEENEVSSPETDCRKWMDYKEDLNCTLIAVDKHGKMTLREVAKRMGVSFVRIKQIQDKAEKHLSKNRKLL